MVDLSVVGLQWKNNYVEDELAHGEEDEKRIQKAY